MATANFTTKPPMLDDTPQIVKFINVARQQPGTPHRQIAEKLNLQSRRATQQMRRNNFQTKECPN
jgi:hypothetical protein